jgi:glycine/D-amino acid oxidase-like deaminating enzyme
MFADDEQKEKGQKRAAMPAYTSFIERVTQGQGEIDAGLTDTLGGVLMRGAWVDLKRLLAEERARLESDGVLFAESFDPAEIRPGPEGVVWRTVQARGVVYCDGYKSAQRGPFAYLPWQPAKGEALSLRSDAPQKPFILNREGWALPLGEGLWRTGTSWAWEGLDEQPTEVQKEKLIRRFRSYFGQDVSVEVTAHVAGVRPCTSDNLPFLGTHPTEPSTHLFNGLGPRGTVWAPTLAEEMAEYLVSGKPFRPDCDLRRFG